VKNDAIKKYQKRLELAYKYTVNKAIEDSRLSPHAQCEKMTLSTKLEVYDILHCH